MCTADEHQHPQHKKLSRAIEDKGGFSSSTPTPRHKPLATPSVQPSAPHSASTQSNALAAPANTRRGSQHFYPLTRTTHPPAQQKHVPLPQASPPSSSASSSEFSEHSLLNSATPESMDPASKPMLRMAAPQHKHTPGSHDLWAHLTDEELRQAAVAMANGYADALGMACAEDSRRTAPSGSSMDSGIIRTSSSDSSKLAMSNAKTTATTAAAGAVAAPPPSTIRTQSPRISRPPANAPRPQTGDASTRQPTSARSPSPRVSRTTPTAAAQSPRVNRARTATNPPSTPSRTSSPARKSTWDTSTAAPRAQPAARAASPRRPANNPPKGHQDPTNSTPLNTADHSTTQQQQQLLSSERKGIPTAQRGTLPTSSSRQKAQQRQSLNTADHVQPSGASETSRALEPSSSSRTSAASGQQPWFERLATPKGGAAPPPARPSSSGGTSSSTPSKKTVRSRAPSTVSGGSQPNSSLSHASTMTRIAPSPAVAAALEASKRDRTTAASVVRRNKTTLRDAQVRSKSPVGSQLDIPTHPATQTGGSLDDNTARVLRHRSPSPYPSRAAGHRSSRISDTSLVSDLGSPGICASAFKFDVADLHRTKHAPRPPHSPTNSSDPSFRQSLSSADCSEYDPHPDNFEQPITQTPYNKTNGNSSRLPTGQKLSAARLALLQAAGEDADPAVMKSLAFSGSATSSGMFSDQETIPTARNIVWTNSVSSVTASSSSESPAKPPPHILPLTHFEGRTFGSSRSKSAAGSRDGGGGQSSLALRVWKNSSETVRGRFSSPGPKGETCPASQLPPRGDKGGKNGTPPRSRSNMRSHMLRLLSCARFDV